MTNLEKTREQLNNFIANNSDEFRGMTEVQIFNNRGTSGDEMVQVYKDQNITILYASVWNYFEIFGLTPSEWKQLMTKKPLFGYIFNEVYVFKE